MTCYTVRRSRFAKQCDHFQIGFSGTGNTMGAGARALSVPKNLGRCPEGRSRTTYISRSRQGTRSVGRSAGRPASLERPHDVKGDVTVQYQSLVGVSHGESSFHPSLPHPL